MAELGRNRGKKYTRVVPGVIQGSCGIRIEVYQELYGDLSGVVYEVASGWLDSPIQDRVEAGEGLVWFIRGMQDTGVGTGVLQGARAGEGTSGTDPRSEVPVGSDKAWEEYRIQGAIQGFYRG
ncbi:MAG: hypothetical protein DPW09_39430 [Anaerolineae bacterium]|nr:hypothetical protein [Anaerolineae bacterium]